MIPVTLGPVEVTDYGPARLCSRSRSSNICCELAPHIPEDSMDPHGLAGSREARSF
jgi:hypothetical protein